MVISFGLTCYGLAGVNFLGSPDCRNPGHPPRPQSTLRGRQPQRYSRAQRPARKMLWFRLRLAAGLPSQN